MTFSTTLTTHILRTLAGLSLAWVSLASPAAAAEPAKIVYEPAGAPADPRVPAHWNRYHDYAQATELVKQIAAAFPELCRLESLGPSYGRREMWLLTITNGKRGDAAEKSGFWIDGGIHANEIQATEVVLYTAWYLTEMYGRSPLVSRLLDERVFYLLPMMSPDSRDAHMHEPNSTHSPRSGLRPVDDDRDGLVDEDKPDDLDGDGHIAQMRIADPHGRWKPHPDFPNLMIRAKPDEPGQFTLLGTEGFDNDGDGQVDEDGDGYYDPNRNWPWSWQPKYVQTGADQYPLSVSEDRMVADFIDKHPNIAGAQSYHNAGGMILRGPCVKGEQYEAADLEVFNELGNQGARMLPNYRYLETATGLYELHGGELDWLYNGHGIFAFTNELFSAADFFHQKSEGNDAGRPEDQQRFNKYLLLADGTIPWHEVSHPQYGKVEVGGFKKSWLRQPPSFLLEEECHRNMAFTCYHADQMPLVEIEATDVKALGNDLFQLTATVVNRRLMPSRAAVNVKHKLTARDRLTIRGDGVAVLAGLQADNRLFEHPQEQKRRPHEMRLESVPGMKAIYVRWIVAGRGPYTLALSSIKGGAAKKTVDALP